MRWLDYVCAAARNSSSCETVVIGKSSEQRDLKVIKVTTLRYVLHAYIIADIIAVHVLCFHICVISCSLCRSIIFYLLWVYVLLILLFVLLVID